VIALFVVFVRGKLNGSYYRQTLTTFKSAVDTAIAKETVQKDVPDLGSNSQGKRPSVNVNKVKRDNLPSGNRTSEQGGRHGKNDKQTQSTGG